MSHAAYTAGQNGEVGQGSIPEGAQHALDSDLEAAKRRLGQAQYVRPVGGAYNQAVLDCYDRQGLEIMMWDVEMDTGGSGGLSQLASRIRAVQATGGTSARFILLFHDQNTWSNVSGLLRQIEQTISASGGTLKGYVVP